MGSSCADAFDRTQDAGENLTAAGNFKSRLDDVANPRDACRLPRRSNAQSRLGDAPIFQNERNQRHLVDLEDFVLVGKALPQANLADGKFRNLKLHSFLFQRVERFELLERFERLFSFIALP